MRALYTALLAAALLAAAPAHAGGHLSAEAARYSGDTTVFGLDLDASGWLYGASGRLVHDGALFAAVEGHALAGAVDYDLEGDSSTDPTAVAEGRGLIGADLGGTTLYTGLGYRHLTAEPGGHDRTSANAYVPIGLTATDTTRGGWHMRTVLEYGYLFWGQESLQGEVLGVDVDETVSRSSGWQFRAALEFRKGIFEVAPYVRFYSLDQTDSTNVAGGSYYVEDVAETEYGLRAGIGF
ncbi:MAG: hypothetical protein ACLFRB_06750 [Thiohalorhabdus sp.]|uniref:hypothetical protein n=1 Tax=Thiohalorhabdus sp. TaxID=3094134 RepID=UPI0039811B51